MFKYSGNNKTGRKSKIGMNNNLKKYIKYILKQTLSQTLVFPKLKIILNFLINFSKPEFILNIGNNIHFKIFQKYPINDI